MVLPRPLIVFTFTLSLACAQELVTLDKIEVQETYSTLEERKENSISKRIIKSEELAQYGDLNALEMLKRTAGVSISEGKKKGAPGKGYTKVLIDGEEVSVSSKRRSSPLEQISPDMIERIEIMSNGSAEYTAEAMGGIVNIILKKPKSDGLAIAKITAGAYGDSPMGTLFAQYEKKEGKVSYLINGTYSDTQKNETTLTDSNTLGIISTQDGEDKSRARSFSLNGKVIYTANRQSKYAFDGTLGRNDDRVDTHDTTITSGTVIRNIDERNNAEGTFYVAKLLGDHHIGQSMIADWKLITHERSQEGQKSSLDSISSREIYQEDTSLFRIFGGNANLSYAMNEHFFKTGMEYRHLKQRDEVQTVENGVNTTLPSDNVTMDQDKYAVYVQDEWSMGEKAVLTPGLRYEKIDRDYGVVSAIDYFAPSVHFLYRLTSEDNVRASVAKTVKLPRLDEISSSVNSSLDDNDINNPDITGNPSLKEESALSYELRLEHYFTDKGIVSLNTFYRNIEDKIEKLTTLESTRYVERPYNAGEAQLWGVELEVKKSLATLLNGLGIWGNATVQNSTLENTQTGFNGVIGETPDYLLNIGLDHAYAPYRLTYGAAYRYNGGFEDPIDQSGIVKSQKGYGVLDLYATKRLDSTFKLSLNLKNITSTTIETTSAGYSGGVLNVYQVDKLNSDPQILLTLEGKW
ncbi:MAG TPA: TonB-dependent receptor [Sulfuricurvum sp.]|nr:TonB-dependent receptor [Sulfuricurvum sp.]